MNCRMTVRAMRLGSLVLVLAFALAGGCSNEPKDNVTINRTTKDGLPNVTVTGVVESRATIEAVDYDTRGIALRDPDGNTSIFTVGPDVANFRQIKKGDVVKLKFIEKTAVSVRKVNEPPESSAAVQVDLAPLGAKPGIVGTKTVEMRSNVASIDYQTRMVTLVGQSGVPVSFKVDPKTRGLEKVQKGDQVVIVYTQAVSITVVGP
jgi:hypothetical protein